MILIVIYACLNATISCVNDSSLSVTFVKTAKAKPRCAWLLVTTLYNAQSNMRRSVQMEESLLKQRVGRKTNGEKWNRMWKGVVTVMLIV